MSAELSMQLMAFILPYSFIPELTLQSVLNECSQAQVAVGFSDLSFQQLHYEHGRKTYPQELN
jgi:hypothetical protein